MSLVCLGVAVVCYAAIASRLEAVDLIGYLPYYRMNASYNTTTLPAQLPLLDEVRYFGLTINNSGVISPLSGSGTLATHLGNIASLKQLIETLPVADRPRLNITLGGADEAAAYATVAASSTLRSTLATNVDSLLDSTGATSVDIDWEHPSGATQRANYALMVQRIKQEIGNERGIYATMSPEIFMPASAFQGPNAIDGVSLMTYDLGWWGNDPANPLQGEHSVPAYVVNAVDAWTEPAGSPNDRTWAFGSWGNNTAADLLGIGLPFYGRGIVSNTAYTYAALVAGGTTTDGNYYNYAGQTVWTVGPELVEQRVQFAHDRGLKNIIVWEIAQDLHPTNPNSLLRHAFDKRQSLLPPAIPGDYNGNGSVGPEDYQLWASTFGLASGDLRADGSLDGVIDAADYTYWRDRAPAAAGGHAAITAVPEPKAVGLAATALFVGLLVTYRRGEMPFKNATSRY
jgi:GH18 family chitinase